nr:glycoside hydrolase family 5 [uncultured bacterium]
MACNSTNTSIETQTPDAVLNAAPFSRGINFSQWFETPNAQSIQFTRFIEQDFINVKSMGVDVIRLPIRMHSMTRGAPEYVLDPLLLKLLDTVVDWAEKHQMYLIIDNHSFDPVAPTDTNIDGILLKVWAQIAQRYKNRGKYVVYEILNEPHGISDSRWGEIQGMAIETIRKIDTTHAIIVGGTDYNSINKLFSIPEYSDPNLIYTFHFYDPHLFTHQGASWGEPSLASLAGVPFPADVLRIPKTPDDLKGTWVEGALRNYKNDAAFSTLLGRLDKTVAFSRERKAPVFCGEFGVYMIQSPAKDRVKWYEVVAGALGRRKIARASWDYFGGFGIFNNQTGGDFHSDVNVDVVRALGFLPPPQRTRIQKPLNSGFTMYGDYPSNDFSMGYWGEDAVFSMYDTNADEGEYAIRWGNAGQYDIFWIAFDRNGDFSYLAEAGYCLEFRARTEKPVSFDVRFVNPENASSIPWRMRYSINEKTLLPNGKWQTIRVPLANMTEHGAWVNATQSWLGPQGKFSWKNVKQLEFVAEDGDLKNRDIWFDSIRIMKP